MVKPKETKENREKRLSCMWMNRCMDCACNTGQWVMDMEEYFSIYLDDSYYTDENYPVEDKRINSCSKQKHIHTQKEYNEYNKYLNACIPCKRIVKKRDIYNAIFSKKTSNQSILSGYEIEYEPDYESDNSVNSSKKVNHYSKENEIKVRGIVYREFKNAPRKSVDFEYCADDWTEDDIWLAMVNEALELIYGEGMDKWKPYPKETKFDRDNMKIEIVCSDGKTYVFELINR